MNRILSALFACALALSAADLTGKWTGTLTPAGSDEPHSAVLNLKQSGSELTGTAGPHEDQQVQIAKGKVEGDRIQFEITEPDGAVMRFDLRLVGERLQGEASGQHAGEMRRARIDVSRAK